MVDFIMTGTHVLSAAQFANIHTLIDIFSQADKHKNAVSTGQSLTTLTGKTVCTLFFEPSTRTRLSFETAAHKLGAHVLSVEHANVSSSGVKGESLEDTFRTISGYADCIVVRHPSKGVIDQAAHKSYVPIINAGDGSGEHPTQAILDAYTIWKRFGTIDGLTIGLVGDLKHSRTIHSLLRLVGLFSQITLVLISPEELRLPEEYLDLIPKDQVQVLSTSSLQEYLHHLDVIYVTRVQKERFTDQNQYEAVKDTYILTPKTIQPLKSNAIIMHPLPRVNEISPLIDNDPRAIYFEQAHNGVFVRMALLESIIGI